MPRVRASRLWRRSVAPLLVAGLLAGACLIAACGGDSGGGRLLSSGQASDLRSTLSKVEQDVADGDCTAADQEVSTLQSQLDSISRLDRSLRQSLRASVRRLETLVSDSCDATTTAPTETTHHDAGRGPHRGDRDDRIGRRPGAAARREEAQEGQAEQGQGRTDSSRAAERRRRGGAARRIKFEWERRLTMTIRAGGR